MRTEKKLTGYPSIDKPWLKYYDSGVAETPIPKCSIYQIIKEKNKDRLNKIAIELRSSQNNFNEGIKITYKQFFNRIDSIAKSYYQMGLRENEIVITILPNIPESRELIYGLNAIGATVYPVSPMISAGQLQKIIGECKCKHIAVFAGFYEKFKDIISQCSLNSILYITGTESLPSALRFINNLKNGKNKNKNLLEWHEFIKTGKNFSGELQPYYNENHIAIIVGTSGTTGIPKGVCLTDDNLNAIALQHGLSGILDEEDVMLDALIQSIGYGISTMHYSTFYGYKNILIPELLTNRFAEVLCKVKPDHFTGGPVHCQNLLKSQEFISRNLPKMKNLVSGGATLPKDIEKQLNNVDDDFSEDGIQSPKVLVRQGFGATENGGCGAYAKQGAYKFGGVGIPLPFDTISIFEPGTDNELSYNQEGEICICGPTVMKGYYNNEKETNVVLKQHKDGEIWLHLADLGHMDEDGQLFITDRIKNIFMRTGFNVHPSKIAEYISSLDEVSECAVIGVEHLEQQKVPVAFIVISKEYSDSANDALSKVKDSCFKNLEEMSVPYDYVLVDSIPRNLGGKVDNNALLKLTGVCYTK
ncbi:MAG: acyl--CoA ligase [Clostridia bacterium]|nr:acyl--CoA ligase [Clostridia bacterium]